MGSLCQVNSSYDSILCFLGLEACWIQEHSVEEDIRTSLTDLPLNVLLSHLPCMCLSISLYMVSFAFKLISVYTKFSRKNKLVWLIHGLLHETPLRCALFALLPVPFLPALAFYPSPLTVVEKMSSERFWLLVSVLVGDDRLFFSGEWCLTHPSITLSCPVDSCYSLWRSQSVGPDEQGLLHLTGRFLSTWNHYRDKSRRWKGSVKWKFSRFVHIIVKHCWIFGCPSCCPLSVEVNIASWTDALIFSASLQISQGDRKLWWFHNSLQGICFLSDKYSLTKGSTWRKMPCGGCNWAMCSHWEGMRSILSSAKPWWAEQSFLRFWGIVCRHGLWVGQGVRVVCGGCAALGSGVWWSDGMWSWAGCAVVWPFFCPGGSAGEMHWAMFVFCADYCYLNRVSLPFLFLLGLCGPGSVFSILCSLAERD